MSSEIPTASVETLGQVVRRSVLSGALTSLHFGKALVPAYVVAQILDAAGVTKWLGEWLGPAMGIFGLSGQCALVLVSAYLINIYAALAVIATLHPTAREVTILAVMTGFAHALITETAIFYQMRVSALRAMLVRLVGSLGAGIALGQLWRG